MFLTCQNKLLQIVLFLTLNIKLEDLEFDLDLIFSSILTQFNISSISIRVQFRVQF